MGPTIFADDDAILVLDVGGGHVSAAAVSLSDTAFRIDRRTELPLDSSAGRDAILATLSRSMEAARRGGVTRCVAAMPGPFDYALGSGRFEGIGKFDALAGLDLRATLAGRLGIGPADVSFVNDAVAYGIGEWAFGAGRRTDRMVCLTLGTGVGSAFLNAGSSVAEGRAVPLRGEAHTVEFDGSPLETTVSTAAIRRAYTASTGTTCTVEEIFTRARTGDETAHTLVTSTMLALGHAMGPWIRSFGATTTVVGGAMSRSWDLIESPLQAGLQAAGAVSTLRPAALLDDAPLVGAAVWAARP
ncbi:glucokinase [Nakamurella panacisegetis]|uniref:Glucokinase n=2 Tax=Nakamurella panacisegetis TaxID=1090615 RepID=A0A1H0IXZ0_9ACTN|nr:glucokinase [Nakamurella panacisegetis]